MMPYQITVIKAKKVESSHYQGKSRIPRKHFANFRLRGRQRGTKKGWGSSLGGRREGLNSRSGKGSVR